MSWRLHLTNQAITDLDILSGKDALLCAWSRRDRAAFYDLKTGVLMGETTLMFPSPQNREDSEWQNFVAGLKAPGGGYLPHVRTPLCDIYLTDDGRVRLYHTGGTDLFLDDNGTELKLDVQGAETFRLLTFDRFLGLTSALDENGKLHIYQQHIRVGEFDIGLDASPGNGLFLAMSRGGSAIYAGDGDRLLITDSSGRTRRQIETHYVVGSMACAPDGRYVITGDGETGVLRVYSGEDLTLLYQRFAIDLLAGAKQLQLLADLPPFMVGLSALRINNAGVLAFSMAGIICVSDLSQMDALPRPQALL